MDELLRIRNLTVCSPGLEVVEDPQRVRYLAVGFDPDIGYRKLALALSATLAGMQFVATNDDGMLPSEDGFLPGP